jgi:hypothetical protein
MVRTSHAARMIPPASDGAHCDAAQKAVMGGQTCRPKADDAALPMLCILVPSHVPFGKPASTFPGHASVEMLEPRLSQPRQ